MAAGNSFITLENVISDAASELPIEGYGQLGKPFFVASAQRGLTDLNYETNFFKKEFIAEIPENLVLQLPGDLTEKDQAYLANMDGCDINGTTILFIKPNMWHLGGEGYFAQNKGRNHDKLQYSFKWSEAPPNNIYFAGERSGKLFLSPSCRERYTHVVIPYTGIGMDCFGEDFEVPMWAREALTDYVIEKAARALRRGDPQYYTTIIREKEAQTNRVNPAGSWCKAIQRYKRMDKKGRYDNNGYNFRFGHVQ